MEIKEPFKRDNRGLIYVDSNDIQLNDLCFKEIKKSYGAKRQFFKIEGIDDYIIKDSTWIPLHFNQVRNRNLLQSLVNKQKDIPDVDFPIGYYRDHNKMKGIIIPYYQDALSLRKMIYLYVFDDLKKYYNHDSDDIDNLINLLVRILELLSKMYDNGVMYLDIHSGNFVFKDNDIKIIDFDPGFVFFKDKDHNHYERILSNYASLVETICRRLKFKPILFNPEITFMETERKVKKLKKELER